MRLKKIGARLQRHWYLVLLALATFESWTSGYVVRWFGEPTAWALLTMLIALSLYALLGKKGE